MNKNTCNICKIRAYIQCDICEKPLFFCSRGHLQAHKIKIHSGEAKTSITYTNTENKENKLDLRKLFKHIQSLKNEIEIKIKEKNYIDAILNINKCLQISKKFYQEDHIFNLELIFKLSECYIRISNLDEAIDNLEKLITMTENNKTNTNNMIRFKSIMLIGVTCINIGDYSKALKQYTQLETEVTNLFTDAELLLKQASINLNIGICYIYMGNPNIAEKYLKKGLLQTEGMLGNEIIYKLNADLNENLGVIYEQNQKPKEAITHYKKSLKTKFNLYGEKNIEVLDLQYKISSVYLTNKQFKEAEEIMTAMTDVVLKEKLNQNDVDCFFRFGVYFYTTGMILLKNNKINLAKEYLNKANSMWKDILSNNDPVLASLHAMIKICNTKN